jgi:hypothetical protein
MPPKVLSTSGVQCNPKLADIFAPQYLGSTGSGPQNCVVNGVAANWQVTYPLAPSRPGPSCLTRCFAFTGLYTPEAVAATLNQARTYDSLRTSVEGGCHGAVHLQSGGSCGDMAQMYSTNGIQSSEAFFS